MRTSSLGRTVSLARAGLRAGARLASRGAGSAAEEFAEVLGDLRGLAAKVGQMASYVEGMVPDDPVAAAAFARLRAQATPSDPAEIRAAVQTSLGSPVTDLFATWDDAPLASASLGQVHRATLPDGTAVAVKVLHPGIRVAVAADLAQAERIGSIAGVVARGIPVDALIAEIRARLTDELDLAKEADHQERYAAAFAGDGSVGVPAVHRRWCTSDVLTTTLVEGAVLEDAERADVQVRSSWAVSTWRFFVAGVLRTSLLHGDPHPGNILFRPDGGVWALDYGCVQPLSPADRAAVSRLLDAATRGPAATRSVVTTIVGAEGPFTDAIAAVWCDLLAPVSSSRFRVDRAHARRVAASIRASKDPRITFRGGGASVPPWFVLAHRTFVGLVSVLAHLDVEVDYATPTRDALG